MSYRLFSKGPIYPSPPSNPETLQVIRVCVRWMGTPQKEEEIPLDSHGSATFAIGEDPTVDFLVPKDFIGERDRFELASVHGATLSVSRLENMSLSVTSSQRLAASSALETQVVSSSVDGAPDTIPAGETGEITLGPWTFEFSLDHKAVPPTTPVTFDTRSGYFFGFSFILHAVFLFAFYLVPPSAAGLTFDETAETSRYVKIMLGVQEAANQAQIAPAEPTRQPEAKGGKAHADIEGEMGERTATKTRNRSGLKGPPDNLTPHMKKEDLKAFAETGGIFAMLSAQKMPMSPFGLDTSKGFDPENALGALVGDDIGSNLGYGALGLRGTGRGGGGDGHNTIGVGSLGRIAWTKLRGPCTGPNCDFIGKGRPPFKGRGGARINVRTDTARVVGALSKDTIRRIVRRHLNEIKFCYERGLQKRPDLAGRVSVKFLIEPGGGVKTAHVAGSTTGDDTVDQCIARTVSRMVFPMPKESGIVIVTYPFTLASSEG